MFQYFFKKKINFYKNSIIKNKVITEKMTDEEIKNKFNFYKNKSKNNKKKIDKFLVPIFSLVREIIHRKLKILLFPTQIIGGIILHYGNIAQMNTGEGKTLTAILPICLNCFLEKTVFVITVNDYLSKRDWELSKPIFDFFGISSGVNLSKFSNNEKKIFYENNVIYSTGSREAFNYLSNNLSKKKEEKVKQNYYYAIIDEIDSILIDEAQNPLIISKIYGQENKIEILEYKIATHFVKFLIEKIDYKIEEKEKKIWIIKKGIEKIEKIYKIKNLFSSENNHINFYIHNALKAKHFYKKNVDYVVNHEEKKILIIDSLTGRLVKNRVYGHGLQQAIEDKENLLISKKSKTIAMITYQNFFRLFDKLSGMTGTALEEKEEFSSIYGMEVFVVPNYKKNIRKDLDDLFFFNKEKKYKKIISIIENNLKKKKRPILVGSTNVETSEYLSNLLKKKEIIHNKLNAINHEQEAEIISKAGELSSITISTNMAGRGVDIKTSKESEKAGGLLVIGIERNFSRRIDDQLKGRTARQGNKGKTIFFNSLEDEIVKNSDIRNKIYENFSSKKYEDEFPKYLKKICNIFVSECQEKMKLLCFFNRKKMLDYDIIINKQRNEIYNFRNLILESENYEENFKEILLKKIDNFWSDYLESINRIKILISVKIYLPENPQESFFWEVSELFENNFNKLKKEVKISQKKYLKIKNNN